MYLGTFDPVMKCCEKHLKKKCKKDNLYSFEELMKIQKELLKKSDKDDNLALKDVLHRFFSIRYLYNGKIDFENGANGFREWDKKYKMDETLEDTIKVPKEYQKLEKVFQKNWKTEQPEQRTQAWYDFRYRRVTASDTASALDENPYEPVESFILKKCDPNFPFFDNKFVFHGKKYEPPATQIYEHIYNNKVTEFGCLPSKKYKIVAASPDGICSKATLNNEFSPRLGTMLEIKCPFSRKIIQKGKIDGTICPHYYYCQVQQQLECCELPQCDFWQCSIVEYQSRGEYLMDDLSKTKHYEGKEGNEIQIDERIKSGCILQFQPKEFEPEFDGDLRLWKSKYLYPPRLDMDKAEYQEWILETLSKWRDLEETEEWKDNFYFDKVIYWKMAKSSNVTIKRDKKWFKDRYPILENVWKRIEYYRLNNHKFDELEKIVAVRKKWFKLKTALEIHSEKVVNDKMLFLDDSIVVESDNECDFLD
jgi:putative phage-type endonuclease